MFAQVEEDAKSVGVGTGLAVGARASVEGEGWPKVAA